jgi:predicted GTPase
VVFAYSDVSHETVMHHASSVIAAGADFRLLGAKATQLKSTRPVVSICAVRTGSGKSQTTRAVAGVLRELGYRVAAVRHPMPYGNLVAQAVQRFAEMDDMDEYNCTIENERNMNRIWRGRAGLRRRNYRDLARPKSGHHLWDGNRLPFFVSDR